MSTPKAHAKYAASSSERWVNCPSSLRLIERAPEQKSGPAAEEGTEAHGLMEATLLKGLGYVSQLEDDGLELGDFPREMIDHVQGYVDYVWGQHKPHEELLVEKKVYLDFLHPTEAFGTVDTAIIEPFGRLHVIDFKYGRGYVHHADNLQMIYYALGIAHQNKYDFESVTTTIYQPRASNETSPRKIARSDTFSVEKLKSWRKIFDTAITRAEKATDTSDLNAGAWCKFCPAKIICPAITKSNFEVAKLDFSDAIQPDPKHLTSDQLKAILDRAAYIKLWVKEVEQYAQAQLESGKKIAGWGLVPTKAQRVWRDEKTIKFIERHFKELTVTSVVTPAQAEKILKAEGLFKPEIDDFMNDHVVTVSSGTKLSQLNTNDYDDQGLDDLIVD